MGVSSYSSTPFPLIVTSSTRPASPSEGWVIYETDTNREWTYNGTAWRLTGGLNTPRFRRQGAGTTTADGQDAAHGANVAVDLGVGTEVYDTDSLLSAGNVFTVPTGLDGIWQFDFNVFWNTNANGIRASWLQDNTGTRHATVDILVVSSGGTASAGKGITLSLNAGQTIQPYAYHTAGTTLDINFNSGAYFQGYYVGPTS